LDFLKRVLQWFRFPVVKVEIFLHLNLVWVLACLVGVVVEVFGLEEHVASHKLVEVVVQLTIIRMAAPGDESALLGEHGERKSWDLEVHDQVLALVFSVENVFLILILKLQEIMVNIVRTFTFTCLIRN